MRQLAANNNTGCHIWPTAFVNSPLTASPHLPQTLPLEAGFELCPSPVAFLSTCKSLKQEGKGNLFTMNDPPDSFGDFGSLLSVAELLRSRDVFESTDGWCVSVGALAEG
jgi:hypothetical protein